jgi:non-ribosomal peptide synthetase component F
MSEYFTAFVKNAAAYGERTAIVHGGDSISYAGLIQAARAFGEKLREGRSKTGRIIPVTVPAGIEWFAQVLGILSADFAAVPVSAAIPPERAEFILRDIENTADLPEDAALIYYTSGSTGKPKGVVLTNANITAFSLMHGETVNLRGHINPTKKSCANKNEELFRQDKESDCSKALCLTNEHDAVFGEKGQVFGARDCWRINNAAVCSDPSFDAFLLMAMPALLFGVTLHIPPDEVRTSLVALHKYLIKYKIEITFLTTQLAVSYMRAFDNKRLKTLLTGGEALRGFTLRSYDVWNLYGPCEATVYITAHKLTHDDADNPADIPIGKATGTNRILLTDGEICIAGHQVSAGYLNRPDETAERFVPNPEYNPERDDPAYRIMYKTGDLAEYDKNGELHFRGRADNQVKISGYRIEPGEVEAKIMTCSGIKAAKVSISKDSQGGFVLNAVCVGDSDSLTLRRELESMLPRAMIPANIKFASEIKTDPRTGKGVMD